MKNILEAEITFEKYVTSNTVIMSSKLFTIDELVIENKLCVANLSDDGDEEYEAIISPSFILYRRKRYKIKAFKNFEFILFVKTLVKKY